MSYSLINLEKVTVANRGNEVLKNVTLEIPKGKIISVIGYSGSGKTTLLKLILDLLFPEKGWQINGEITRFPGLRMAWVLQNASLQVFKNFVYEEFAGSKKDALKLLKKFAAEKLLERRCLELSQGEKTIVAILKALSHQASLIILDEVMVNLSLAKRKLLNNILRDYTAKGGTVITVEHSPQVAALADQFYLIENGATKKIDKKAASLFFKKSSSLTSPSFSHKKLSVTLHLENIIDSQINSSFKQPISIKIAPGDIIGIKGDNGSGKSTLLEIICGIRKPKEGTIYWQGKKLTKLHHRKKILTLITQDSMQHFLTPKVSAELMLTGANISNNETKKILDNFHLTKLLERNIATLSYGEKQRLAIVSSILSDAPILLFDEPTYGMDVITLEAFLYSLSLLSSRHKICIISSHEASLLNLTRTSISL